MMEKTYIDKETQTEPELSRSPSPSLASRVSPGCQVQNTPNHALSPTSTQYDSAHSYSLPSESPTEDSINLSTGRVYKYAQLTYNRPPKPRKQPANRVVSLPETEPLCSIKNILEANARVISMSERPKPNVSADSLDCFGVSASTENSYPTEEDAASSRRCHGLQTSDVPHTPTPPSSPESVMIIENSVHLPRSFLRHNPALAPSSPYDDNDGWITWANSPPRPIPALHGPLSLPYARCPSGAEGTIIEGPDDLPRMIWGLGPDDILPSHPRVVSHNTTSHKPASNISQPSIPSRVQKSQLPSPKIYVPQAPRLSADTLNRHSLIMNDQEHNQASIHQRTMEALGSRQRLVDTYTSGSVRNNIPLRGNTEKVSRAWSPVYGLHNNRTRESFGEDLRAFDMERGLGLDWQSHEELDSPIRNVGNKKLANHLKASAPAFIPSGQLPLGSHPRIFVEPRLNETVLPRRMSAIEMAQKYRQQQQQQQQLHDLLTPPLSSSPHWSPYFTSFQDSPDPVSLLPPRLSALQAQQQIRAHDSAQQLDRFLYEHRDRVVAGVSPSFATSTQSFQAESPRLATQNLSNFSDVAQFLQRRNRISSPSLMSPPRPGPPPNSPLPPVPTRNTRYRSSLSHVPLSPRSPETRTRSVSYQQPLSIPLARLARRRLSSVAEEDLASFMEHMCSPPQSPSRIQLSTTAWSPQSQSHSPPFNHLPQYPRTPSPDKHPALAPQTTGWQESDITGMRTRNLSQAKVKLPHANVKVTASGANRSGRAMHRSSQNKTANLKEDGGDRKINSGVVRDGDGPKTTPNLKKKGRGKKVRIVGETEGKN